MSSNNYPDHLNPFDSDEDNPFPDNDYPDHLDPFGHQHECVMNSSRPPGNADDYDDSLNPFEDEVEGRDALVNEESNVCNIPTTTAVHVETTRDASNPFDDEPEPESELPLPSLSPKPQPRMPHNSSNSSQAITKVPTDELNNANENISALSEPPSVEPTEPPKPLPRTKSLLKKELALKRRQQELQQAESANKLDCSQPTKSEAVAPNNSPVNTFQRRKNKRAAPPVPVNFKRQVSGSMDAIENELNDIGDKLSDIEKEYVACKEILTAPNVVESTDFEATKTKFTTLIRRKNSILRRQKELMYQKREMKLDQIHSDIEYELRMIGNKQVAIRTPEDEAKEKELLKRLVEIVEEKSDIAENLNKEAASDEQEIHEALTRLNLNQEANSQISIERSLANNSLPSLPSRTGSKHENCDKLSLNKFSKIATLLPKGNTIKGTMKLKRKHLFKKNHDSQSSIDR